MKGAGLRPCLWMTGGQTQWSKFPAAAGKTKKALQKNKQTACQASIFHPPHLEHFAPDSINVIIQRFPV